MSNDVISDAESRTRTFELVAWPNACEWVAWWAAKHAVGHDADGSLAMESPLPRRQSAKKN
jgi:hypothetical protein